MSELLILISYVRSTSWTMAQKKTQVIDLKRNFLYFAYDKK